MSSIEILYLNSTIGIINAILSIIAGVMLIAVTVYMIVHQRKKETHITIPVIISLILVLLLGIYLIFCGIDPKTAYSEESNIQIVQDKDKY